MDWDPRLETGESSIDDQHRRLIELFNQLEDAESHDGPDAVRRTLDELTDHVGVHFAQEEDLMRRIGYPPGATEEHVKQHRDMTETTREAVLEYRAGELTSVSSLTSVLGEWLSHHVLEIDRKLIDHIRQYGVG